MSAWAKTMEAAGYVRRTIADLMGCARQQHVLERYQVDKRQTRFTYVNGPMFFLGQKIVKAMEDAGYPAKISECYRSPERQQELYAKGRVTGGRKVTNALPFQSAHQFFEAVDIIHPERGWDVTPEYWETLAACVRIVADKFGVTLEHGHYWAFVDSAHIELADWEDHRAMLKADNGGIHRVPSASQLWARFNDVLPAVARDYTRRHGAPVGAAGGDDPG
ncbi:M15 family metallopeptidase [Mameliella sp. CS4]|uniref:M15 family metallopeptidase n=1 Tax=Mameliella sp. CS4 TaxID=2862329 RepID=UPI001C5E76F6|nr:M15 family metallopeptidase [Mameliella sp. CS4]MBW4983474.1 M15 family metallopeptidase [Mameliella sp. CS4]